MEPVKYFETIRKRQCRHDRSESGPYLQAARSAEPQAQHTQCFLPPTESRPEILLPRLNGSRARRPLAAAYQAIAAPAIPTSCYINKRFASAVLTIPVRARQ